MKLKKSALKTIEQALKKHKKVTAEIAATAEDAAGTETRASRSFTLKH